MVELQRNEKNLECVKVFSRVHTTLHPALSVGRLVTLYFFYDFYFWTLLLQPKWSNDLKYGPCPPARDFGSRVSDLVVPIRAANRRRKKVVNAARENERGKESVRKKNKAGYMATPVACGWTGAIIEVTRSFGQEQ